MRVKSLLFLLALVVTSQAELLVERGEVKTRGQRTIVPLKMKNTFDAPIESARMMGVAMDADGKATGHAARWIIGGDESRKPLKPGDIATFHFVISTRSVPGKVELKGVRVHFADREETNGIRFVERIEESPVATKNAADQTP